MRICIVTPAPPRSTYGNRITAIRWARILKRLGHRVFIERSYDNQQCELLIALHALRSHDSVARFRSQHPAMPIIIALTGTDVYRDLKSSIVAQESLEIADKIVALQPRAIEELPPHISSKAWVIYQSAKAASGKRTRRGGLLSGSRISSERRHFDICVIGHLRPVKDPFRAALASRLLPRSSSVRILQIGSAMTESMRRRACDEMKKNHRFVWMGEQPHWKARQVLARSRACISSSQMEGGANVLSEAIVNSVPVLASRIPGALGILGEGYEGYSTTGDTRELARLITRAETDPPFLLRLKSHCDGLASLFDPTREIAAWIELLNALQCR